MAQGPAGRGACDLPPVGNGEPFQVGSRMVRVTFPLRTIYTMTHFKTKSMYYSFHLFQ